MVSNMGLSVSAAPIKAVEESDKDLAMNKDVVAMADCPLYMQGDIINNPGGSYLKVNDGDDTTGWTSLAEETCLHKEHWIYLDFIKPVTFDQVKIVWDQDNYAEDYKIQVSNTGRDADWYDREVVKKNETGDVKTHDFESTTARYVRVYVNKAKNENGVVGIKTLSVFQKQEVPKEKDAVNKDLDFLTEDILKSTNTMLPEITNSDLKHVKASLNLPKTGFHSSEIEWSVIPDDGGINLETGEVTRGDKNQDYKLTAKVTKGDVSKEKTFDVTVQANVIEGAKLREGEGRNYLTAGGNSTPMPYVIVQNCGMQTYSRMNASLEEKLAQQENDFEKTADLGYKRIGVIFKWKDFEPTNAGEYDWRIVDQYIEWCNKYDLYWDIVWFGSNSCGGSRLTDGGVSGGEAWLGNLPTYVDHYKGYFDNGVHSGAPAVKCPVLKGPNYEWIKANEIRAVQDLMDHIAQVDKNQRTACFQVMNEPYWHEASQAYWKGGYRWQETNAGEDRWIYDWISDMAVAIKASDYNLPTRINGSFGAYSPEQYTWLNDLPGIDFMGDDSYNANVSVIEDNISNKLSGTSFPHIAENDGSYANTSSLVLTALINGGGYHTWQLAYNGFNDQAMTGDDSRNWKLGQPANWRESGRDMSRLNLSMNCISELIAVAPKETMAGFNIAQNNPQVNCKETSQLNGMYVGYECDDASVAMAVKKDKEIYLVSDSASDGNGTVNFLSYQAPVSASYGEMKDGKWVVSENVTAVQGTDGIYRVPVKSGKCIRFEFESAGLPQIEKLSVSEGKLEPEFSPYVHEYEITVGEDTEELCFTAELNDKNASFMIGDIKYLSGRQSLPEVLAYGETEIQVNVAWDALGKVPENTYTIRVHRETPEKITAEAVAKTITKIPELSKDMNTAAFIQATGAVAGSQWDGSIAAVNVINNSGMSGTSSLEDTHDNQGGTAWHTRHIPNEINGEKAWIQFDFGRTYALDEMWIWNMNQANLSARGLKNVKIEYSADGEVWKELEKPEDMTFTDGVEEYPFQFAQATGQSGLKATNLNDGKNSPVSFGGKEARYVKISAHPEPGNGSWGEPYFGLSEVRFTEYKEKQGDIVFPVVPDGFAVSIEDSSNPKVIDLDGNVTPDEVDRVIMLTLRVTNTKDKKDTAVTKPLPVKVMSKKGSLQNVNLALNKPVIDFTGGQTGEVAANAVDGNYLTRYVSSASIQSNPASFTVDLGYTMEFNQMVTMWESARVSKYSLEVSEDNKKWKEVVPARDLDHDGKEVDNFETVSARYVRFNALKNGPNAGVFAISEIEIYNRRLISENYILRDLELSAGTLSPAFNSDTYSYDVVVGTETDSLVLTPIQDGEEATVKINGKVVKNGQASETIPLQEGKNLITVFVQDPESEDSIANYEIHVLKKNYPTEQYQNVLLNKTVTCPGYGGGFWHTASNINDGNKANHAQPSGGIADYQFDLGDVFSIDQFTIVTGIANYITDFDIKTSLDGVNWTTVQRVKGYQPTMATYEFEPVNARYILLDNIKGSGTAAINEVEAYGYPIGYSAQAVAGNIGALEVTVGQTELIMPEVPAPYAVRIKSSSNENVIDTDGKIIANDTYQETQIVLEVYNTENVEDIAETRAITVTVPPMNLTCENVANAIKEKIMLSIPQDVTTVALPVPPAGFTATYTYVEGDKDLLSFDGNTLTVHPQRTNGGANFSLTVTKDGTEESYTTEQWLIFQVAGRSATAQEMIDEMVVECVQQGGTTLVLPEMPEGYKLEIMSSSNQKIINLVGGISEIASTTDVDIYLKVTKLSDETSATKSYTITVLSNVQKEALDNLIAETEGILWEGNKYTAETFRAFVEAFREAKRVSGEISSDQEQVDAAKAALELARNELQFAKADITALQNLYNECADITEQGDYTEETWQAFVTAKEVADTILQTEGVGVTQEEVEQAFMELLNARVSLTTKVNVELLLYAIDLGEKTDKEGCTKESVKALEDALKAAKDALKPEAEDLTEEKVTEFVQDIMNAIAGLEKEETPIVVEKSALQKLFDAAGKLTEEKYTIKTWEALSEAMELAESVLEKEEAVQEEIDEAYDKLLDAMMKLMNRAETSGLKLALDTVQGILADKDLYVKSTLEGLDKLAKEAEELLKDTEVSQKEVNDMMNSLTDASKKAKKLANKENLAEIIRMAETINTELYTKETVKAFESALQDAKDVMNNEELSIEDKKLVDDTLLALVKAMNELEPISDDGSGESGNAGNENNNGTDGNTENKDNTGAAGSSGGGNMKENSTSASPKTGDSTTPIISFTVGLCAILAVLGISKKVKR